MQTVDNQFYQEYEKLITTGSFTTSMNMSTSFFEQANTKNLWGMFVNAGYLTILEKIKRRSSIYTIRIPNGEVRQEFEQLTMDYLHMNDSYFIKLVNSICDKKKDAFIDSYKKLMLSTPSFYDLHNENSIHMFLLGICVYLIPDYEVLSNRESGAGRCDIILKSKRSSFPNYVLEFKYVTKAVLKKDTEALRKAPQIAMKQIIDYHYDNDLTGAIVMVGIAQCGKEIEIIWDEK